MQDERIQTTANRIAAVGYQIWYFLMGLSLCYRTLILKQPIRDYWDILAIFFISTFFVFIAYASKGVFAHGFKKMWLIIGIVLVVEIPALQFIMGHIHSVGDVVGTAVSALFGVGLAIGITFFLTRHWKRKAGLEEEK